MTEKRSKYDTDPLDPEFVKRAEENLWGAARAPRPEETDPLRPAPATEDVTRRFDEQMTDSYPSVFVPPAYQPPRAPQPQPFTTFGAGPHQPPATTAAPPPGPSSPYPNPHQSYTGPTDRPVARLGLPEKWAVILPYFPFYIGLVASIIELAMVPRAETRTRFHAAQGLALNLAILAVSMLFKFVALASGSNFGGALFGTAATVFLIVSVFRVWQGKPHHIAPLDEPAKWLGEKIAPTQ
ncbi:MAG TPA: hypothetical protein VN282_17280 [Pyrinomonadaceae bacterium]|nr:hypothetical protein [Pyrinomonadaceae bacterium]